MGDIKSFSGNCFLGIDIGSTTTKAVLIDENNQILILTMTIIREDHLRLQ